MMELESVDEEDGIYRLLNHNSSHDIYVSASRMGMYYHKYAVLKGEEWVPDGADGEAGSAAFSSKDREAAGFLHFLATTGIGLIIALFVSVWFTRHAKLMELSGRSSGGCLNCARIQARCL